MGLDAYGAAASLSTPMTDNDMGDIVSVFDDFLVISIDMPGRPHNGYSQFMKQPSLSVLPKR